MISKQTGFLEMKNYFFCSEGSVGVDYLITFIDASGVSHENLRQELLGALDLTNNGAFIGGSTFKVSNKTNSSEVAMELILQGKWLLTIRVLNFLCAIIYRGQLASSVSHSVKI